MQTLMGIRGNYKRRAHMKQIGQFLRPQNVREEIHQKNVKEVNKVTARQRNKHGQSKENTEIRNT